MSLITVMAAQHKETGDTYAHMCTSFLFLNNQATDAAYSADFAHNNLSSSRELIQRHDTQTHPVCGRGNGHEVMSGTPGIGRGLGARKHRKQRLFSSFLLCEQKAKGHAG